VRIAAQVRSYVRLELVRGGPPGRFDTRYELERHVTVLARTAHVSVVLDHGLGLQRGTPEEVAIGGLVCRSRRGELERRQGGDERRQESLGTHCLHSSDGSTGAMGRL
jgi:hypothetical protein